MSRTHQRNRYFQQGIRRWFAKHRRDLPWRKTHDPYRVVVSELMLQQTQVSRVIPKYTAFISRFPTWSALADASLTSVLRMWSGLGYNRRARQLQDLARAVVKKHHGMLPDTEEELMALPGIGPYTARAILVFALRKRAAPKDTNIERVVRRHFFGERRIDHKKLDTQISAVLPARETYWWNHALMDFGAGMCTARKPQCATCPLQKTCKAAPHFLSGKSAVVRKNQSIVAFKDSQRYLRGRILRLLVHGPQRASALVQKIRTDTGRSHNDIQLALHALRTEGLLVRTKGRIEIP